MGPKTINTAHMEKNEIQHIATYLIIVTDQRVPQPVTQPKGQSPVYLIEVDLLQQGAVELCLTTHYRMLSLAGCQFSGGLGVTTPHVSRA